MCLRQWLQIDFADVLNFSKMKKTVTDFLIFCVCEDESFSRNIISLPKGLIAVLPCRHKCPPQHGKIPSLKKEFFHGGFGLA